MVAVQKLGMGMLVVEFREVAVDGFGMAAFGFELDRQMLDAEVGCDALSDGVEQFAGEGFIVSVDLHMRGHHDEARLNRPDVQVMDILHTGNGFDGGGDLRGADAGRGGLQEDLK